MLSVPFVFSTSRFQGPAFRCDKIAVIVTLLEAIEGIPDKDYNFGENENFHNFTRDVMTAMSESNTYTNLFRKGANTSREHGEMPITTFLPSRITGNSSINFSQKLEQLNQNNLSSFQTTVPVIKSLFTQVVFQVSRSDLFPHRACNQRTCFNGCLSRCC